MTMAAQKITLCKSRTNSLYIDETVWDHLLRTDNIKYSNIQEKLKLDQGHIQIQKENDCR